MKKSTPYLFIIMLLLAVALSGCGGGGKVGGEEHPTIGDATILVNDGTNPIEGAAVILAGSTKTTNVQGLVVFNDVPAGDYTITAAKANFANGSANITIVGGKNASATVALSRQFGSAVITVNNGTNPISGATVNLNGQTETTNTDGQVTFNNVAVGNHTVTVAKTDYANGSMDITITNGETTTATVTLSRKYGSAKITVNDGTSPINEASVTLNGETKPTDAQGQATFNNVPVGAHPVTAEKTGYNGNSGNVTIAEGETATATISLTRQTGNVTITVKDGTNPISEASVTLNGQTKTTDSQGQATFTSIPTGNYTASVSKSDYISNTVAVTVTNGTTNEFPLSLARQTGNATITVNDGASPIEGASVTLNGQTKTTNTGGQATFNGVPFGTYTVYAEATGYDGKYASVTVVIRETATATISLIRQKGSVSVWVKDNFNSADLNGATVIMAGRTVTTVNGRADFLNVPTGTYTATASCASYGTATLQVTVVNGGVVDPSYEGPYKIFLNRFVATQIIITMRDQNGNPLSGVTVTIHPKDVQSDTRTGTTNASGQVVLNDVQAGLWRILASSSNPYRIPYGMDFTVTTTDMVYSFSVPFWSM